MIVDDNDFEVEEKNFDDGYITTDILKKSARAEHEKIIYESEIKKEKAIQERIKTEELKKDLAPFDLIKHFFSFAENLIQRLHRRPNEIIPQIEAFILAKERNKAVSLIVREMESIVKEVQKELIQAIEEDGYKYKQSNNK